MALNIHQQIVTAVMEKLTPSQQSAVVRFAKELAGMRRAKKLKTGDDAKTSVVKLSSPRTGSPPSKKQLLKEKAQSVRGVQGGLCSGK
jgi:hypothetical protein